MQQSSIEAFLKLVQTGLLGDTNHSLGFNIKEGTNWGEIFQLAEEQSVVGLVAAGLDWFKIHDSQFKCPQEVALQFIGATLQIEQQNKAMNEYLSALVEKLRKAGVYTLVLKGQGVAQCYEKPLWRSCGDVDLFLSDENYEKAQAFLMPLASEIETEETYKKHLGMTIDGWMVELHGRLYCGLSSRVERELDQLYQDTFMGGAVRSWNCDGVQVFLMKEENDVFYVFTHILQHFFKEGLGMRQVCDWCRLLWTYRKKLDLTVLESRVRRVGLMSEWKAFGSYAVGYLGMPTEAMPFYSVGSCWKKKAKRINEFILEVGNLGHNRDMSHFSSKLFFVRKCISAGRRFGDLINHARIFPLDSLRFSFSIMKNGLKSAVRGEG